MKKQFLSTLLLLCMVLPLLPGTALAANDSHPFMDVAERAWYSTENMCNTYLSANRADTVTDGCLTVATNAYFPPYEYIDGRAIVGIDVDIASALAERLGLQLKIVNMYFDEVLLAVESKQADIGLSAIPVTPARAERFNLTDIYYTNIQSVIVNKDSSISSVDDIFKQNANYSVGVPNHTTAFIYALEELDDTGLADVYVYETAFLAIQALKHGLLDCVIIDNTLAKEFVAKENGLKVLDRAYSTEMYVGVMSKYNDDLYKSVNNVLKELIAEGAIQRIVAKYIYYNSTGPEREDNVPDDDSTSKVAGTISDETILRAKLLTVDHSFDFYRKWDSPVQIMTEQLDPTPAVAWYTVENLIDMYYKSAKSSNMSSNNVADVTTVEFYEYLLFKLLDSEELKYMSITEPFGLIDDLSNQNINGAFLKKLLSTGFKGGTKITDENLNDIKNCCISICGTDSVTDIGWLDAILVPGKTIDNFVTEFIKLYALTTVSDARAEAIRIIGENTQVSALQTAAKNVYSSIQQAKKDGIDYCVGGSVEASLDNLTTWLLDKIVDKLCDIHPVSKIWKVTTDVTTLGMDTIFLTDDISTDTIYILGVANVERALLSAIDTAEESFQNHMTVENAQQLIALADTLKRETLVGCDLIIAQVDHCERGNLNWNGLLDLISMIQNEKVDFFAIMRWIFGDPDSSYTQLRKKIVDIKKSIEITNFYAGSVSVLDLLREVKSTTPSTWASSEINKAINYGILPEWMQNNYQNNLTRIEFCALLEYMIEEKTGKTSLQLADELAQKQSGYLKAPFKPPFDDALYMEVNDIARLGIISGVGNNMFNPLGEITRQEAAAMLYRTANVLGYDTTSKTTDHSGVADWAVKGVDFVITKGIMVGTDNGFEPESKYTKEQSILTLVRFFESVH